MSSDDADQVHAVAGQGDNIATLAVIAFTRRGCLLAQKLASGLSARAEFAGASIAVSGPARFVDELIAEGGADAVAMEAYESLGAWTACAFGRADALIYVGACGIAVRAIAPHVRDKFSDPAVVSVDEAGRFVVPLLSGHVGGANELARAVADVLGAQPVVSTATDVNNLFAVDEWAARRGLQICERVIAKEISARLLEGGKVGFAVAPDVGGEWDVPESVVGEGCEVGFAVTLDESWQPFERTLHLVPRIVTVGVGCRKDADPAVLRRAVDAALESARVSPRAVGLLASIDVKREEAAILQLAAERNWDLSFYTAEELAAVPGDFASSDFVRRTVGVDNVCERAALAQGGRLLAGKQAGNGTTVALAVRT